MTLLLVCAVALPLLVVAAFVARARLWGGRIVPGAPSPTPPSIPLLYASYRLRGRHSELVPVLVDWGLRGVMRTDPVGPYVPADRAHTASPGPIWRFTVGQAVTTLTSVEGILLVAMFGHVPVPGESITIERDDVEWRERVQTAIVQAGRAQRAAFGESRPRYGRLRAVLVVLVIAAGIGTLVGAFTEWLGRNDALLAVVSVAVPLVMALAITVAVRPAVSDAERLFSQQLADLGEWIRTTEEPIPALGGWAMLWNLPGPWADALPEEAARLRNMDRAFLRGDYADTVPIAHTW